MTEGKPKEIELEEELDSLYRKVSSSDESEGSFFSPQQLKTQAVVSEEPIIDIGAEKWPLQRREERRFRVSRIIFLLLPPLILGLIAFFFWPLIYHYDALNLEGKVYPLRISRLTGEATYFDGALWLRPPIPAEAKDAAPAILPPQPAAVMPPEATQTSAPAPEQQAAAAPPNKQSEHNYAIQIKAFPEDKKKAAEALVDDMKKNLPDVRLETVHIRGRGIWHRILVGHFPGVKEASDYLKESGISRAFRDSFVQRKSSSES